ncbi:MAG: accessory factor UbiK family protein [Geminicoccaceae bacterium]|nr:accessory factor UbiK family protein [Geminicoccaceae bacterium]
MQTENRLFNDLARMAGGAFNTLGGLREEIELRVRERVERLANEMDLVSREELEAVKAMAAKADGEREALLGRMAALEAEVARLCGEGTVEASDAPSEKPPVASSEGGGI